MGKVIGKLLSGTFTISSALFANLKPDQQTTLLKQAGTAPIKFIPSFAHLQNKKLILDKLMTGKDISAEMEFLGVEFSKEERAVATAFKKILDKVDALKLYSWLEDDKLDAAEATLRFTANAVQNCGGYQITLAVAKKLWNLASPYWAGGKKPANLKGSYAGYTRTAIFHPYNVIIGCQTVSRAEFEACARRQGWEPNL